MVMDEEFARVEGEREESQGEAQEPSGFHKDFPHQNSSKLGMTAVFAAVMGVAATGLVKLEFVNQTLLEGLDDVRRIQGFADQDFHTTCIQSLDRFSAHSLAEDRADASSFDRLHGIALPVFVVQV